MQNVRLKAKVKGQGILREVAQPFTYPGGELHLKDISTGKGRGTWIADVRGAGLEDLVTAALLADVAHGRVMPFALFLPYLPAARSDRGEPTGARVYANLINGMHAQQVITIDAHSPVMPGFVRNLTQLRPTPLVESAINALGDKYDAVIAPDKGAYQRALDVAIALDVDIYQAEKTRDFETGQISGVKMRDKLPLDGRYLVVDDICDGGGTFMGLADATNKPTEQLGLWVTHGIFSGKANLLRRYYRKIYTTDSHPGHSRLGVATTVVPTETYMLQNLKEFA